LKPGDAILNPIMINPDQLNEASYRVLQKNLIEAPANKYLYEHSCTIAVAKQKSTFNYILSGSS